MPATIDIHEDLRYQQGVEEGIKQISIKVAGRLLSKGLPLLFVQEVTNLPLQQLEEIQKHLSKTN